MESSINATPVVCDSKQVVEYGEVIVIALIVVKCQLTM